MEVVCALQRDQGQYVIDKPETIEYHGFDRLTCGEVPHFWVLLRRLVHDFANTKLVKRKRLGNGSHNYLSAGPYIA